MDSLHDDMHRLASVLLRSEEDASDAVQDTMMKLWKGRKNIPQYREEAEAYCFKALRLNCFTLLNKRESRVPLPYADFEGGDSSDSSLLLSDSQRCLLQLIDSLPENQSMVIRLSAIEGKEIPAIARLTGFTEVNVRQLISRARKTLREKLTLLNN